MVRRFYIWVLYFVMGAVLVCNVAGCDPFHTQFEDEEDAQIYQAIQISPASSLNPQTLKVMTWNIKFGAGRVDVFFDCYGDRVILEASEVENHLDGLAAKINQYDPDIILLQEADLKAKRTAYINQVQGLLDRTKLNYAAYASQWKADTVPSDGLGYVDSGNAILSKYPIKSATRLALPFIGEQDGITQYFYLKRNILRITLDIDSDTPVYILNTHTSAYSNDGTKRAQIDMFKQELDRLNTNGATFVAGGDLNALPPGTVQTMGFKDEKCEGEFDSSDYSQETDWLDTLYNDYKPAVDLELYKQDNRAHFTHTTNKDGFWTRKLDYLFTNTQFTPQSGLTHQNEALGGINTMPLSDHAPITALWELK